LPIIVIGILAMMLSCKSAAQREVDSRNEIEEVNRDYAKTKAANASDWNLFKEESYVKLKPISIISGK
jgi:hypothetical protein